MRFMVCIKCQQQRNGRRRMLRYEGYRKAVYGKTVRTVVCPDKSGMFSGSQSHQERS